MQLRYSISPSLSSLLVKQDPQCASQGSLGPPEHRVQIYSYEEGRLDAHIIIIVAPIYAAQTERWAWSSALTMHLLL